MIQTRQAIKSGVMNQKTPVGKGENQYLSSSAKRGSTRKWLTHPVSMKQEVQFYRGRIVFMQEKESPN